MRSGWQIVSVTAPDPTYRFEVRFVGLEHTEVIGFRKRWHENQRRFRDRVARRLTETARAVSGDA